jgi:hypothetical protein
MPRSTRRMLQRTGGSLPLWRGFWLRLGIGFCMVAAIGPEFPAMQTPHQPFLAVVKVLRFIKVPCYTAFHHLF